MKYTPEQREQMISNWERRALGLTEEDWQRAARAARLPQTPAPRKSWKLGVGVGMTALGLIVWPLGAAAIGTLWSWRRANPDAPAGQVVLAAFCTVLGMGEIAILSIWLAFVIGSRV